VLRSDGLTNQTGGRGVPSTIYARHSPAALYKKVAAPRSATPFIALSPFAASAAALRHCVASPHLRLLATAADARCNRPSALPTVHPAFVRYGTHFSFSNVRTYFNVRYCRRGDISFTVFFVFLWVTPTTESTKFGSRYLVEGLSERDEIRQIDRGGLAIHHYPDW